MSWFSNGSHLCVWLDLPEPIAISHILHSSIIGRVVASLVMVMHISSSFLGRVDVVVSILVITSLILGMVLAGGHSRDSCYSFHSCYWGSFYCINFNWSRLHSSNSWDSSYWSSNSS